MNKLSEASRIIPATSIREGAGVVVNRTIGTPMLRHYDPFLLLDHISSDQPQDYLAGFPAHPHRGFSTFTYMIDGQMTHHDSMGNHGDLGPGAAQWMKAASGVIHSEMPKQQLGLMRGFQLWINLPAAHKMDRPEYREYSEKMFPVLTFPEYTVKVLVGHFDGINAPIIDPVTEVTYLDVQLQPDKDFRYDLPNGNSNFIYVFEGHGQLANQAVQRHSLVILDASDNNLITFLAGNKGARFIVVSGKPIHEPIVRYGPFVMSTKEQIDQAMKDFQSNQFVRERAWINQNH